MLEGWKERNFYNLTRFRHEDGNHFVLIYIHDFSCECLKPCTKDDSKMSSKTLQATWIVSDNSNVDVSVVNNVKQTQQQLPTVLGLPLKVFDDVTECTIELGYSSSITEKTILILDANVAQEAIHLLHNMCHIVCIFVYWMDFDENLKNSLEQLHRKYNKVSLQSSI